ncbi:hypothetical protein BC567DRAFT_228151 [Phyllosticta citribraziliensis]
MSSNAIKQTTPLNAQTPEDQRSMPPIHTSQKPELLTLSVPWTQNGPPTTAKTQCSPPTP